MGVPFSLLAHGEKEDRKKREEERGKKSQTSLGNRERKMCEGIVISTDIIGTTVTI